MFRNGVDGAKDMLALIDKVWCLANHSKERFLRSLVPYIPLCFTPNKISWSRIFSAIGIIVMLVWYEDCRVYGIIPLFIIAIIGDIFDGAIARERGIETTHGAFLDRSGDKLLICPIILRLFWTYHPIFVFVMVLAEIVAWFMLQGKESEWLAKYKMAAESTGILILLFLPSLTVWALGTFVSSMVLGVMSFISGVKSRTA